VLFGVAVGGGQKPLPGLKQNPHLEAVARVQWRGRMLHFEPDSAISIPTWGTPTRPELASTSHWRATRSHSCDSLVYKEYKRPSPACGVGRRGRVTVDVGELEVLDTLWRGLVCRFHGHGVRIARWPQRRSCRRWQRCCSCWPFVAHAQRSVPVSIGQDPGTARSSASDPGHNATAILQPRSPSAEPEPATVTDDSQFPKNDRDTGLRVANARRCPQNIHAHVQHSCGCIPVDR
jgi:hypothetical protein